MAIRVSIPRLTVRRALHETDLSEGTLVAGAGDLDRPIGSVGSLDLAEGEVPRRDRFVLVSAADLQPLGLTAAVTQLVAEDASAVDVAIAPGDAEPTPECLAIAEAAAIPLLTLRLARLTDVPISLVSSIVEPQVQVLRVDRGVPPAYRCARRGLAVDV